MERPNCKCCGGPLDIVFDLDEGEVIWCCNNPRPIQTDADFSSSWGYLGKEDAARLEVEGARRTGCGGYE